MKKIVAIMLSILMLCSFALAEGMPPAMDDTAIVNEIVDAMTLLTAVPRPSHHEEKKSAPSSWTGRRSTALSRNRTRP